MIPLEPLTGVLSDFPNSWDSWYCLASLSALASFWGFDPSLNLIRQPISSRKNLSVIGCQHLEVIWWKLK